MNSYVNDTDYLRGLEILAGALNVPVPRIAQRGVIPKGLVLEAADFFQVELENGTAEEQLAELIDRAGLVDRDGQLLNFAKSSSGYLAKELANQIRQTNRVSQSKTPAKKSSRLLLAETIDNAAKSKLEAVNQISALTRSGPETLGPGSKERKSVLVNLYRGLNYGEPPEITKSELGRSIARRLGVPWDSKCYSTGETITLEGLNRLLVTARQQLTGRRLPRFSVNEEASMYAGVILQSILDSVVIDVAADHAFWDGRSAVEQMLSQAFPGARQTEWPGWFFEFKAIPELRKKYGGGPIRYGTTTFDYRGKRTWDLKTHSEWGGASRKIPLNDKESTKLAIQSGGLGFIILRGVSSYEDESAFYEWHNYEVRGKQKTSRSARSRKLKTGFFPKYLDFYFIHDLRQLELLEDSGVFADFNQGRQQDGSLRKVKYQMRLGLAQKSSALLESIDIEEYFSSLGL